MTHSITEKSRNSFKHNKLDYNTMFLTCTLSNCYVQWSFLVIYRWTTHTHSVLKLSISELMLFSHTKKEHRTLLYYKDYFEPFVMKISWSLWSSCKSRYNSTFIKMLSFLKKLFKAIASATTCGTTYTLMSL